VPAPRLEATREADGRVRVRNVGTSAALTVRLVDRRPVEAPSADPRLAEPRTADPRPTTDEPPLTVGGDPRPLLPGEERILESRPAMAVRVEAWNAAPIDLA
jgi:beta-mannosidase